MVLLLSKGCIMVTGAACQWACINSYRMPGLEMAQSCLGDTRPMLNMPVFAATGYSSAMGHCFYNNPELAVAVLAVAGGC